VNDPVFQRLYIGTPYVGYRKQLAREFQGKYKLPEQLIYQTSMEPKECLDLETLELQSGWSPKFSVGQDLHLLLLALFRDLYRPVKMGEIFARVYPDEFFNPFSSPDRVYQLIKRLRKDLKSSGIKISIASGKVGYQASLADSLSLLLHSDYEACSRWGQLWKRFVALGWLGEFSANQVRQELDLPHMTTYRFLEWCIQNGHLQRVGSGPRTRYLSHFKKAS
jgi:hypothetical protein